MTDSTVDDDLADGLLGGDLSPAAAPQEYRAVAALLQTARGPAVESELVAEAAVVGAAAAAVRSSLPVTPMSGTARRRRVPGRLTAAAMAGAVILGGSAAAAATDNLPGPAQTAVSDALSHVGISVPKPNGHANKHALGGPGHSGTAPGHSGTAPGHQGGHGPSVQAGAPAEFGLCTAFLAGSQGGASGHRNSSTAFANLIAAHGGSVASTTTYCQGVVQAHTGSGQSEGTDDDQGSSPAGSGEAPGDTPSSGGGAPAHPGKPSTSGSSSPGANGGGQGAGHSSAPNSTSTTTSTTTSTSTSTTTSGSDSSTIHGHSPAGPAHG